MPWPVESMVRVSGHSNQSGRWTKPSTDFLATKFLTKFHVAMLATHFADLKVVLQHMEVLVPIPFSPTFRLVSEFQNHTPAWKLPSLGGFQILANFPTIKQHLYSIKLPTIVVYVYKMSLSVWLWCTMYMIMQHYVELVSVCVCFNRVRACM